MSAFQLRLMRLLFGLAMLLTLPIAQCATPLRVPELPLGSAGAALPVNVLLAYSVTDEDAGAAYRDDYQSSIAYAGYFNSALCYQYPLLSKEAAPAEPDLSERGGYFAASGSAGAGHDCKGAFSGNFLNWASSTRLDLLRLALTGGDRVVDTSRLTILQRAWLPDGTFHADFYAHPQRFPRKVLGGGAANSVTPFTADVLYVVSCRNRLLFSDTNKGGGCDAARMGGGKLLVSDKSFGEFAVRVKVCDDADAALRPELCTRYGAAFKPEGVLQAASQQLGVMGYASVGPSMPGASVQSGVLRAPIKSLGETTYSAPSFEPAPNTHAEWNATSGVLNRNPDGAAAPVSGAINYVNRLGRAGPTHTGAYPPSDPGAELFYESLRYLQGRDPGVDRPHDDGLPIWPRRADPIALACQRNIVALVGHNAFTDDRYVPGNTRAVHHDSARATDRFASAPLDVMAATGKVGQLEAGAGGTPRASLLNLALQDDGPDGAGSFYLAGASYWAHTNAIRPDKAARVDTFGLELGPPGTPRGSALYYAVKFGAFRDQNGDADPFVTTHDKRNDSEWRGAAGDPAHYIAATDPHAIVPAVRALFANMGARDGWQSGPVALAGSGAERYLIETTYDPGQWRGGVRRRNVQIGADGTIKVAAELAWDAQALLDSAVGSTARRIYTLATGPDGLARTVPFLWDSLTPPQRALLSTAAPGHAPDRRGEGRLRYLRGAQDEEGVAGLRRRAGTLGDIVNSTPLIVGPPSRSMRGDGYSDFLAAHSHRPEVAYVGANDGMLHAFETPTGKELFAYIPNALLAELPRLTMPGYRHRPYVDASAGHGEAVVGGHWRTVLASGMGMGARGVFALDVTDPSRLDTGLGALWEFTDADDAGIGHIRAPPLIARLRDGVRDGKPQYRDFVIVSSAINPASDGAALFLLALDKPASEKWRAGVNYYKIVVPAGDGDLPNALSAPVLAIAADGSARHAYAGDLQGRLWRFSFGSRATGGALTTPLFVARDASGVAQPFSHAPRLVFAPGGGYLVLAGTGKFIEPADALPRSFVPQSFYAIRDNPDGPATRVAGRGALVQRTVSVGELYRIGGVPLDYAGEGGKQGWYLDFPNTAIDGERVAGPAQVRAGAIVFDTMLPGADLCQGAASRTYVLDALTGFAYSSSGAAEVNATTGQLTGPADTFMPPLLMELSISTAPRNATGGASATRVLALVRLDSAGATGSAKAGASAATVQLQKVTFQAKRLSWREVANWQDLHEASKK